MSHCNALKSPIDTKQALQQIYILPEVFDQFSGGRGAQVRQDVLSDTFWVNVTELRAFLEPISAAIMQLEGDKGMLFSVYGVFKTLLRFYESCSLPNKDAVVEAA